MYIGTIPTVQGSFETDGNYKKLLEWADHFKRMKVYANCETIEDVKQAVIFGAEGIFYVKLSPDINFTIICRYWTLSY